MKLELEVFSCLCSTKTFRINGIEADSEEFGQNYDEDSENAPDYGCGNMTFHPYEPKQEIMDKYNIDEKDWYDICNRLEELSFGCCDLCS